MLSIKYSHGAIAKDKMKIGIIKGDGIGTEVVEATMEVLSTLIPAIEYLEAQAGYKTYQNCGTSIPNETIEMCKNVDATLFGAVTTPPNIPNYKSAIITLRKELDLFANFRPIKEHYIGAESKPIINLVIFRENTEGLYSGQEEITTNKDGSRTAITKRIITEHASKRIVKAAYEYAIKHNRHKVTIVHKANILRETCGLFRNVALNIAKKYPTIKTEEMLVDAMAMRLIKDPQNFDILVTTNLFGDILSDEASALVGGLGLAASANIGDKYAIFEPVHGSAPDIANKGIANPLATIQAAQLMLEYLGEEKNAKKLNHAISFVVNNGPLTPDLGGKATTKDITKAILDNIR